MIRVIKSSNVPTELTTKGVPATVENCRLYEADPADYQNGIKKFDIDPKIYSHADVKKQLIAEQYGKCCFCEADFTANGYGDVEHFRPKAGYSATRSGKLTRPGYYWLAYDWENLFFSCQICNQRYKKNYFPLSDETQRAKDHTYDYQLESSQLIHPSQDNPEDHITFNLHVPVGKDDRGKASIDGFGLGRSELNRIREAYLQTVKLNESYVNVRLDELTTPDKQEISRIMDKPWPILEQIIITAQAFMVTAGADSQPFAAMTRAYLTK